MVKYEKPYKVLLTTAAGMKTMLSVLEEQSTWAHHSPAGRRERERKETPIWRRPGHSALSRVLVFCPDEVGAVLRVGVGVDDAGVTAYARCGDLYHPVLQLGNSTGVSRAFRLNLSHRKSVGASRGLARTHDNLGGLYIRCKESVLGLSLIHI